MAYTIVRIAGKHATFESLTMTTGSERIARIECQLDGDPRLIEGASVIAAHVAHQAGLSDAAASEIAAAASQACTAAAQSLAENGVPSATMKFAAAEFSDRIEVTIEPLPEQWKEAREQHRSGSPATFTDAIRKKLNSTTVDGVDFDLTGGVPRLVLVKKSGAAKRRFVF